MIDELKAALEGKIQIHNHGYRADEMAIVIDMAKEFGYKVSTFHHAVESYKIADLLRENNICSAGRYISTSITTNNGTIARKRTGYA